jgi:hypothetical protein
MYYAQFFQKSIFTGNITEAVGDRSVVVLDGRCTRLWMAKTAAAECKKRGYVAWQLFKGDSFTRSSSISMMYYVNDPPSAWENKI